MTLFDAGTELMDDAEMTGSSTTLYKGAGTFKEIDWVNTDLEMGAGEPLWLNIRVGTTAYSSGTTDSDTVQFNLYGDSDSDSQDSNSTVVMATPPRAVSTMGIGEWVVRQPLPYNIDEERYTALGAEFSDNISTGTIDAWIDHGPQSSFDTQVSDSNI